MSTFSGEVAVRAMIRGPPPAHGEILAGDARKRKSTTSSFWTRFAATAATRSVHGYSIIAAALRRREAGEVERPHPTYRGGPGSWSWLSLRSAAPLRGSRRQLLACSTLMGDALADASWSASATAPMPPLPINRATMRYLPIDLADQRMRASSLLGAGLRARAEPRYERQNHLCGMDARLHTPAFVGGKLNQRKPGSRPTGGLPAATACAATGLSTRR